MRRKLLSLISVAALFLTLIAPTPALAYDPFSNACSSTKSGDGSASAVCQDKSSSTQNPLTGTSGLFFGISRIIAVMAGIAAVIIIIISGMRFVTSGGDAAKAKSARDAIVAALIGLVIIALAGSIISFVLSRL